MDKKGIGLVIMTAVISGFSIYLNKFGVSLSDPVVFTFLKNTLVALILSLIVLNWKNLSAMRRLDIKNWTTLLAIGLIGGGIPFILFFKGLAMTSAAQGSFIHKTMFIYVAVLAALFLREKINKYFFGGALLVLIGNLFIIRNFSLIPNGGDFLVLAAALFWAVENIISKSAMKKINCDTIAWARMFFGAIFILAYLGINGRSSLIASLDLKQIGWIMFTAVLLFGYVITWYRGLAKIPVSVATSVLLLGSPVTTLLTILSSEKINGMEILSAFLIVSGVIVIIAFSHESLKNQGKETVRT